MMSLTAEETSRARTMTPRIVASPLELDGYLTGIIVAPQPTPIESGRWLAGLWEGSEPLSDDDAQIGHVVRIVRDRYNTLLNDIENGLERLEVDRVCDYRPMFLPSAGKPVHETVRCWARGFAKAMQLVPGPWNAVLEDERTRILLKPFVAFLDVDEPVPVEMPGNVDDVLDESAEAIPRAILLLRKLAKICRTHPGIRIGPGKVGRNHPCPCGSGKKYKRCCGGS